MRLTESAAPDGPLETVVPSCLHGRVSSPHREETPTEESLDPGLLIVSHPTKGKRKQWETETTRTFLHLNILIILNINILNILNILNINLIFILILNIALVRGLVEGRMRTKPCRSNNIDVGNDVGRYLARSRSSFTGIGCANPEPRVSPASLRLEEE